jgi:hypothetical protein
MNQNIDSQKPNYTQGYLLESARSPLFADLTLDTISILVRAKRLNLQETPFRIVWFIDPF